MTHRNPTRGLAHFRALLVLPALAFSALALAAPSLLGGQTSIPSGGPQALTDLRTVLDTGVVLQDRNGDGIVDDLELRILLSPGPTESEVAAAANLAARFGYESSATDLGLAGRAGARQVYQSPVFLVGKGAVDAAGMTGEFQGALAGLAPGQGVLAHVPVGGAFSSGALAVVGYDASGLLTAAGYLSGRYPGVWAPDGLTWTEVAEKVEAFAENHGLEDARVSLDRIVVDRARPGIARARMVVSVPDGPAFERTVDAFLGLDSLPAAGEEPDTAVATVEGDSTEVTKPDEAVTLSDL